MRGKVLGEIKAHLIIMSQNALPEELNTWGSKFSKSTDVQNGTYQVIVERRKLRLREGRP